MPSVTASGTPFESVCMGGTFSPLHRGHRALILRALSIGKHVFIGVTDGELARRNRERALPAAAERVRAIRQLLDERGLGGRYEVAPIEEPFGRALEPRFQAIVVSPETRTTAEAINAARAKAKLAPLAIEEVPYVLGLDGLPITGTRVARGDIDAEGVEPKRVHLAIGSTNLVKLNAARRAFGRWVPTVEATPVQVASGVPAQPFDEEGPRGAAERARLALAAVPSAGLGVGIEAAIATRDPSGAQFDVQYCAIADRSGRITVGAGPGFAYPPRVLEELHKGKSVSEAVGGLSGRPDIGRQEGAIGFLTRLGATREELTEWAVISALVPRLRPDLYFD